MYCVELKTVSNDYFVGNYTVTDIVLNGGDKIKQTFTLVLVPNRLWCNPEKYAEQDP